MFFKKKKEIVEDIAEKPKVKSLEEEAMEELKAFRDVGEKFNYLGVEMIVTGLWDWWPGFYSLEIMPCLKVDYVTKDGEIKSGTFYRKDLPMLRKENPIIQSNLE